MVNYVLLLPPSEGKVLGGLNFSEEFADNRLSARRNELFSQLRSYVSTASDLDLQKLFGVKCKALEAAKEVTLRDSGVMAAICRFSGVMFTAIDYLHLEDKKNFDSSVVFIDGKYGILRVNDLITNYKLKINAKFGDFNVEKYWRKHLGTYWGDLFSEKFVIDVLPEAHRKVVDFGDANVVRVMFGKVVDSKLKNVGHDSKMLKGELVRYLVGFDSLDRGVLEKFSHSMGYSYSEEYSNEGLVVFLKE